VENRLRWYLGIVSVIGTVPCVVELLDSALPGRLLAAVGLVLMATYMVCAVAFRTAVRRRWVLWATRCFLAWSLCVLGSLFASDGDARNLVVPWLLFVVLPAIQGVWVSQDLCAEASRA